MKRPSPYVSATVALLLGAALTAQDARPAKPDKAAAPTVKSSTLSALKFRSIGPAICAGRIADIAVDPRDDRHWIAAAASGGVWQTRNAGTTWQPVFDSQKVYSIGCVTFDPNDSRIIWVGSGENNSQRSVSYGDGVYKSVDGGRSFKNVGLRESEHIGRIVVDPRNPDRVFVAAQGPLWRDGGDRGLYLTEDGGATWNRILHVDEHTGISEVIADPRNPDELYASSYQRRRHVFTLINGGPGGGVHKSTDGGKTWTKLGGGLPQGEVGRIGLALAPSRPDTVYAIFEAKGEQSGFYRSLDAGTTWSRMSGYISGSPQYYQEIFVDPKEPDRVYSMDTMLQVTEDGGRNWRNAGESNKHVDNHACWIDPEDTRHLLIGCDGGIYETFDRCATWRFFANMPITQFYRVAVDNDFPFYNVYGGTQDNFSMGGPSRTTSANGITNRDWFMTRGGDGFETVIDPEDPDIVYAESQHGGLVRYDRRSGETVDIKPQAGPGEEPLRFNWNAPVIISPHRHTRLYFAANYLFRSDDRGNTWRKVSGNLTRQLDRNTFEVMGKVWSVDAIDKNRSTSVFGNIVALSESPVKEGRLYVGTDDGLIQTSGDGGGSWTRLESFPGVPEMTYVAAVTTSLHRAGSVFAAFDNRKRGDFKPYLLRSDDHGANWISIAGDLPGAGTVHCIVEDHIEPRLLFAGTEFGVYCTRDGGKTWLQLGAGLPTISIRDMEIQRRESDLVLATFGRSFYVLDDYSPLRSISDATLSETARIFPIKRAWSFVQRSPLGGRGKSFQGDGFYSAPNPAPGAVFTWWIGDEFKTRKQRREAAEASATKQGERIAYPDWDQLRAEDREQRPQVLLTIRDATGQVLQRLTQPARKGLHRTTWDLRLSGTGGRFGRGPMAPPGRYLLSIETLVDGALVQIAGPEPFAVERLPGAKFPAEDPAQVLAFQKRVVELNRAVAAASRELGDALSRTEGLQQALVAFPGTKPEWLRTAHDLRHRALDLQTEMDGDRTVARRSEAAADGISSRARNAMRSFGATADPTTTHKTSFEQASAQLEELLPKLRELRASVTALEDAVRAAGGPIPAGKLPDWKGK